MESAELVLEADTSGGASGSDDPADDSSQLPDDADRSSPPFSEDTSSQTPEPSAVRKQTTPEQAEKMEHPPIIDSDTSACIDDHKDTTKPASDSADQSGDKIKSRELKSLMAAAKESNLDTNIIHKRKSTPDNQSVSSSSSSGEKDAITKRNMRSHNPEFLAKHQKFISKVASEFLQSDVVEPSLEIDIKELNRKEQHVSLKRKRDSTSVSSPMDEKKTKKMSKPDSTVILKPGRDTYCWQCHKEGVQIQCFVCPRGYHMRCFKHTSHICGNWECVECDTITKAEAEETRSFAMRQLDQSKIRFVLTFALKRMLELNGTDPFITPVDTKELDDYRNYVVHPMDLTQLQKNIERNQYSSTEGFLSDTKWILHNSIVYNSSQSKLTSVAKSIVKTCKLEMAEIETCPQCYINANTHKDTWFIEACSKPHLLVWAKLKGFPFWPAKAVNTNDAGMVDVRFFGAHDKAWVPVKDVYLYSVKDPNIINKNQKNNIAESIKEVDLHIANLVAKFGEFRHAPMRTPFDPENITAQLQILLPNYRPKASDINTKPIVYKHTPKKTVARRIVKHDSAKKRPSLTKTNLEVITRTSSSGDVWESDPEGYSSDEEDSGSHTKSVRNVKNSAENSNDAELDSDRSDLDHANLDENDKNSKHINALIARGKVRTRGGYPNVTGKVRILTGMDLENIKMGKKNAQEEPEAKKPRRDSDVSLVSSVSDVSRASEKLNKSLQPAIDDPDEMPNPPENISVKKDPVDRIPENDGVQNNIGKETVPINLPLKSMADKIMKKIAKCDANSENKPVDQVKKPVFTPKIMLRDIALNPKQPSQLPQRIILDNSIIIRKRVDKSSKNSDDSPGSTIKSSSSSIKSLKLNTARIGDSDYEPGTDSEEITSESDTEELMEFVKNTKNKQNSNVTIVDVKKIILGAGENEAKKDEEVSSTKEEPVKESKDESSNSEKKTLSAEISQNIPEKKEETTAISSSTNQSNDTSKTFLQPPLDIDIKEEVLDSDEEALNAESGSKQEFFPALNLSPNVTVSVVEKQQNELKMKKSAEPVALIGSYSEMTERARQPQDNISKTIEGVVKGTDITDIPAKKSELKVISVAEINQKKQNSIGGTIISALHHTKQRARKSFPNKATFLQTKKAHRDKPTNYTAKIENINASQKQMQDAAKNVTADKMLYMPHTSQPVTILPPNISFNSMPNANSNIFTMISQNGGQQKMSVCIPQNLFSGLGGNQGGNVTKTLPLIPITTPAQQINTGTLLGTANTQRLHPHPIDEDATVNTDGLPPLRRRPSGVFGRETLEYTPSHVGPVTQLLNKSAQQLTDYFRGVIIETLGDMSSMGSLECKVKELQIEMESQKHKHLEEVNVLKLELASLKQTHLAERQRVIQETRQACEQERIRAVDETKSKQWCAMCLKESQYRCCWSTSYCSYACQKSHWPQHQTKCQQGVESNVHPATENLNSVHSDADTTITSPVIKPLKTYTTVSSLITKVGKHKQISKGVVTSKAGQKNTISIVASKAGSSSVPTLTFVQNNSGGIELVGNHGPIALGGKLITASTLPSKIKGYIVASNAVTNLSPTPSLATLSTKPLNIAANNVTTAAVVAPAVQSTPKVTPPAPPAGDETNDVMEVDDE